jgi:hypothetical protein
MIVPIQINLGIFWKNVVTNFSVTNKEHVDTFIGLQIGFSRWKKLNVAVEGLVILRRIRQVLGSDLGPETGYPEIFTVLLSPFRQMPGSTSSSSSMALQPRVGPWPPLRVS